jgi:hypothetical protein
MAVLRLGYGLEDRSLIPGKERDFSLRHDIETAFEPHPASSQWVKGASFSEDKLAGA